MMGDVVPLRPIKTTDMRELKRECRQHTVMVNMRTLQPWEIDQQGYYKGECPDCLELAGKGGMR